MHNYYCCKTFELTFDNILFGMSVKKITFTNNKHFTNVNSQYCTEFGSIDTDVSSWNQISSCVFYTNIGTLINIGS